MAKLQRFIPQTPDPYLRQADQLGAVKFGHLNSLVDAINATIYGDYLQLQGDGPMSTTLRALEDPEGNLAKIYLAIDKTAILGPLKIGAATAGLPSAILDIESTTQGVLFPRMTIAERDAVVSPAIGLLIYNTDDLELNQWDGTEWASVGGAGLTLEGSDIIDGTLRKVADGDGNTSSLKLSTNQVTNNGAGDISSNTAFGEDSLISNTTGVNNTSVGYRSNYSNTEGTANTGIGVFAIFGNTTGGSNTGVGYGANALNSTSSFNSAFGASALFNNTAGFNNAFGNEALVNNTLGEANSAFGAFSLKNNSSGNNNVAFGGSALFANTTGNRNTAVGFNSGGSGTANDATSVGYEARALDSNAVALGSSANSSASGAVAIGTSTIASNTDNIAIGNTAKADCCINALAIGNTACARGESSIAIGRGASTAHDNSGGMAIGNGAYAHRGSSIAVGPGTVSAGPGSMAFGNSARADGYATALGHACASGYGSIAIGSCPFSKSTSGGKHALAVGYAANASNERAVSVGVANNATGLCSTAIGGSNTSSGDYSFVAGRASSASGCASVAIGNTACSTSDNAVAIGNTACSNGISTAIGAFSISSCDSVAVGYQSCNAQSAVGRQTAVGRLSRTTGDEGTAFGYSSAASARGTALGAIANAGSRAVAIGCGANAPASYAVAIGNGANSSGQGSTVGGGKGNTASGHYSTVSGGRLNTSVGGCTFIGGGSENTVSGYNSLITGGTHNCLNRHCSSIVGGCSNYINSDSSLIGGGQCNNICNLQAFGSTIVGGVGNNTTGGVWDDATNTFTTAPTSVCNAGKLSFIGGGLQNVATGYYSFIGGGKCNSSNIQITTIGGGLCNTINDSGAFGGGTIAGGVCNFIDTNYAGNSPATIGGGFCNYVRGGNGVVAGGANNVGGGYNIYGTTISGGCNNNLNSAQYSTISGGRNNTVSADCGTIIGGYNNTVSGVSSIAGGFCSGAFENYSTALGLAGCTAFPSQFAHSASGFISNVAIQKGAIQFSDLLVYNIASPGTEFTTGEEVLLYPGNNNTILFKPGFNKVWHVTAKYTMYVAQVIGTVDGITAGDSLFGTAEFGYRNGTNGFVTSTITDNKVTNNPALNTGTFVFTYGASQEIVSKMIVPEFTGGGSLRIRANIKFELVETIQG